MSRFDGLINASLALFGVSLKRNRPRRDASALLMMKSREEGVITLLDVGANIGQFASDYLRRGWNGPIVSFEPQPDAHAALTAHANQHPGWSVASRAAIGSEDGTVSMNIARNSVSSSIFEPTSATTDVEKGSMTSHQIEVPMRPLDSLIELGWQGPYALKIDTQGFELAVLTGATRTLRQTRVALIEISLADIYTGGARPWQIMKFMEDAGFVCIAMPETFANTAREEILMVDAIFVRREQGLAGG